MTDKYFLFNGIKLLYSDELDGGASYHANLFIPVIKRLNVKFNKCLEMFAGTSITGLLLVLEGICSYIELVDINPDVGKYVLYNIKSTSLESKAKLIISDLFKEIPNNRYDLIIGNPPRIPDPSKVEPLKYLKAVDADYSLHERFLRDLHLHLNPKGLTLLLEDDINMPINTLWEILKSYNNHYIIKIIRPTYMDALRGVIIAFKGRGVTLYNLKNLGYLIYETIRWRRHFYFISIGLK